MIDPDDPGPDYTLSWPRSLFLAELAQLLPPPPMDDRDDWTHEVELLLEEAFVSSTAADRFMAVGAPAGFTDPAYGSISNNFMLARAGLTPSPRELYLRELLRAGPRLREEAAPRPYYAARRVGTPVEVNGSPDLRAARDSWLTLVNELLETGYLSRAAPEPCVDGNDGRPDSDIALNREIQARLATTRKVWPRPRRLWDEDTFFSMIEIVHDLVTRPRLRWYHDFNDCGWHYKGFTIGPAQTLYRWRVNRLLRQAGLALQLAESGEDVGRLVRVTHDARQELLVKTATTVPDRNQDLVEHAIALFRRRDASLVDKRSACTSLAHVLEDRTPLITRLMNKKDESDLFKIANTFAIRHQNAKQRTDYAEDYLDWIFWWYLATVELTNRLLARDGKTNG